MGDNPYLAGDGDKPDLGGLVIPDGKTTGDTAATGDLSASAQTVRKRKERADKGQPRGARGVATGAGIPSLSETQFAQLYSPAIWEKALCAPADAMAAITGRKHWEVSQKEREALGATGSIAAQCFAVSDPRWLAVSLALITLIDVYGVRIAIDYAEKKRVEKEKERKKQEGG